jgi:translation initiation factor 2D
LGLILQVTLINNLELYGINIQEFARECQHGVAASTSISSVPGKKSLQLLIQGNQVLFVGNLLMGMLKSELCSTGRNEQ